jgi:DNA-binding response OmpR family regulator
MNDQLKVTDQEFRVIDYLVSKNNKTVYWEELAQFAKDPQSVKLKTIKKTVSEIRRKYANANALVPFNVTFSTITPLAPAQEDETVDIVDPDSLIQSQVKLDPTVPRPMVKIKRVVDTSDATNKKPSDNAAPSSSHTVAAHADFVLDVNMKRVKTRTGFYKLNDNEWEVFKYFHTNVGRLVTLSELRDKVVYPQWGSKTPARWFNSIMSIVNNIRRQVVGLDGRLLTVKGTETSYLFQ